MDVFNIRSVQRVVNFTPNNGKMVRAEHSQAIIPGATMICDLPLLFMNGLPTCLENLSVDQLEKFVPYMIRCSGETSKIKPNWWPNEIDFSSTPTRRSDILEEKWLSNLKTLVLNCYSYHGCEYALRLCATTSHRCHSEWTLVDGLDGTMYLYNKVTRQMANFKTANVCSRVRRSLLHNIHEKKKCNNKSTGGNESPIPIYICDTCDSEFQTVQDMQDHEKGCSQLSMPVNSTQKYFSQTPENRVTNYERRKSDLKILRDSKISQPHCLSDYLKKQTARKTILSADRNKSSEIEPYLCENCKINFGSLKKMQDHKTACLAKLRRSSSLPHYLCQSQLNSTSHSLNSCNNQHRSNIVAKFSYMKHSYKKNKRSLIPNKHNHEVKYQQETNVFLCDGWDKEFSSAKVLDHEAYYKERKELTPSPVDRLGEDAATQEGFLKYFRLSSQLDIESVFSAVPRNKAWFGNPLRYSAVPISSPLGNLLHGRSRVPTVAISSKMEKVERYCSAEPLELYKPVATKRSDDDWKVTWKCRKLSTDYWLRDYIYPPKRWWKMPFLRKMRIKEERQLRLLSRICKPMQVSVRKMSDKEIKNYTLSRTVSVRLKKLKSEEINFHTSRRQTAPILRQLLSATLKNICPRIRRLSLQEIKKYTNSTQC